MDHSVGNDVFDRILSASGPLVALKTNEPALLIEQFRLVARRTGQAAYLWRHAEGLVSLRDAQMKVPGCQRLGDALRYILQSLHFGVYLIDMPPGVPSATDGALLRQLSRTQTGHVRRVVLLGAGPTLLATFESDVSVVDADWQARSTAPRLRDGRWIV
ncbi:hypothetical protein SAMN02800694_3242 [Luteibacter sp. UNCMF331Sha3.1]|uniref:hypothetical protein n=1 Tax=Luteibacter sp. UNCMF331Sha3.1 TaxID=1502760 RepID=UPI0008BD64FF|nr:hypothetical protein [Luteibacter sp. UNCMF331Sha3.1]SEN34175.1 hypothetical protein SAMN02800694_3242 [Luteibacter sp. UNCMF331Sha3.1]